MTTRSPARIRRCPSVRGGERSPRNTSCGSWPSTPRPTMARRVRYCAGRGCLRATSWCGAGPVTPAPPQGSPRRDDAPGPVRAAPVPHRDRHQPRALTEAGREVILDVLHSNRFADLAPAEVWAILLDEGIYLGSESTFYRLLRAAGESRERRRQATHPAAVKPELVATAPNQVWSWDIERLHGPAKW